MRINNKAILFLGSSTFFYIIVALFILQALWLALSFQYAMLYDESYHFAAIRLFSETLNPVLVTQSEAYDQFGSFVYANASFYHYVMAFPYVVLKAFTSDFSTQIVALRTLNIIIAVSSLFVYRNLFRSLGLKNSVANISLFVYTLIPIVSLLSATISYDNALIPLTGLFLLLGVRVLKASPKAFTKYFYWFILVGLLAALVKFTFSPVLLAGTIFILVLRHKDILSHAKHITKTYSRRTIIAALAPLLIVIGLLGARYVVPQIQYGSIIPDCKQVMSVDRCYESRQYKSWDNAKYTVGERSAMSLGKYVYEWTYLMINRFDTTGIQLPEGPGRFNPQYGKKLPVLESLLIIGQVVIFFCIVYCLHRFIRKKEWQFIIVLLVALASVLFLFNAKTYYGVLENQNVQVRYLLAFVPIIIVLGLASIDAMIRTRQVKLLAFVLLLIIASQGAGLLKHILTADANWYWSAETVRSVNQAAKNMVEPFVYEGTRD